MKNKRKKEEIRELERWLRLCQGQGALLTLDGEPYDASQIARLCVEEEEASYMGDYIFNAAGKLTELRFDKVTNLK